MGDSPFPSQVVGRVHVLVVDDDAAILGAMRGYFRRRETQYHATMVSSANAALAVLETSVVHVVVSDVCMPHCSGCELHAIVARRWPELADAFVFMSGGLDPADRDYILSTGCPLLAKPADLSVVIESVVSVYLATRGAKTAGAPPAS